MAVIQSALTIDELIRRIGGEWEPVGVITGLRKTLEPFQQLVALLHGTTHCDP
ncbi:hypothetical protein SB659_18410 [Arthrobacter sp. SIMBA_036]|uniref:hypothetical protein n=1 Tax=Arthrobacter sp. SIMBA_036 TaxID=3085778 RepID=UPI00397949F1